MATVVHVGNFGFRPKGSFQNGVAHKLSNGLIRLGHQVINFPDRLVIRMGLPLGRRLGRAKANRVLRALCRDVAPDLLLLGHADTIEAETIAGIRADFPRLKVIQWDIDPTFEPHTIARVESKREVVDATLITTAGAEALGPLRRQGHRVAFLPNPVDFSIECGQAHTRDDLPYDIFYACGSPAIPPRHVFGRDWNMEDLFRQLMERLPRLRPMLGGFLGRPHLAGIRYREALEQTALGLNISRRNDVLLYSSDRLPQMLGNGQAILIDRATGYDRLFTDDEMAFFSSFDELTAKIKALLEDPARRKALAAAGRAKYHALFNETVIARYIMDTAFDRAEARSYGWPDFLLQ